MEFLSTKVLSPFNKDIQNLSNFLSDEIPNIIFVFPPTGCTGTIISILSAIENFKNNHNPQINKIFLICHPDLDEVKEYSKFLQNFWRDKKIEVLITNSVLPQTTHGEYIIIYHPKKQISHFFDTTHLYANPELLHQTLKQLID